MGGQLPDAVSASELSGPIFGTPGYIAPERYSGEAASAACDAYAGSVFLPSPYFCRRRYRLVFGIPRIRAA